MTIVNYWVHVLGVLCALCFSKQVAFAQQNSATKLPPAPSKADSGSLGEADDIAGQGSGDADDDDDDDDEAGPGDLEAAADRDNDKDQDDEVGPADEGVYVVSEDGVIEDEIADDNDLEDDDTAIANFVDDEEGAPAVNAGLTAARAASEEAGKISGEKAPVSVVAKNETSKPVSAASVSKGASVPQALTPSQIADAQRALQKTAGAQVSADGKIGKQTTQAIKDYQAKEKLPITGQLDQATLEKLGVGKG